VAVTRARMICIILFALGACATSVPAEIAPYFDSNKADGHGKKLKVVDDDKLDVDEPSDLAIYDGKVYTVSDAHSKIYEISRGGHRKDEIDVDANDLEAIAVDANSGEFLIADESRAKIWFVDASGERQASIEIDSADDGNSGIEGLAYDDDGYLYVAKEKDPARIYKLDAEGNELDRVKIDFADDLSALAWSAEDGHLYALSDLDHSLYRLDKNLDAEAAWRLPVDHPEGLAFEGTTLFVVSDSDERIYEFTLAGE
jgi:uncharacterized protein YjiK